MTERLMALEFPFTGRVPFPLSHSLAPFAIASRAKSQIGSPIKHAVHADKAVCINGTTIAVSRLGDVLRRGDGYGWRVQWGLYRIQDDHHTHCNWDLERIVPEPC